MPGTSGAVRPARLDVRGLSKTFGPARVLRDVDLSVRPGEIHALVGQNGSGKSTLIKILTAVHTPDPGASYAVDGAAMHLPVRWAEVSAAGVSVVHQDLGLLDQLSVAENVCVGGFPTRRLSRRIDRAARDRLTADTLARVGADIHPATLVGALSAAERAEVAIARAIRDHTEGAGIVVLDESTRALTGDDLARIHALLRRIAADGGAVLLISHNLTEVMQLTDRITVLRDGAVAGAGVATSESTEEDIARMMLGGTLDATEARRPGGRPAGPSGTFTVSHLGGGAVRDLTFSVGAGEILGITGVPGDGHEQIPYLLTGAAPASSGTVETPTGTFSLPGSTVRSCIRAGLALVPERRERDGLAFELSMRDNIALPQFAERGRAWFVSGRWQRSIAASAIAGLGIRPDDPGHLIKQLSGGNQQKVLLAKWLGTRPSLLVLHEPTQAVDVGARHDILRALRRAADAGTALILVSSEPEDLAAACDRVIVHAVDGAPTEHRSPTPDDLLAAVYGTVRPSGDHTRKGS